MESQIEQITPVECRVRVTIPWTDVSPRLDTKLRELKKTARIPGFRQGMVPPKVIERMFGKSVRAELARDLVQETFETAVVSHKTNPLTQPVIESTKLELGEPFTYEARFEVAPKLEPKDYLGVPVRRRPAIVDQSKVDALLQKKREDLTEIRPIEPGSRDKTQPGDVWTVDFDGTIGSEPLSRKDVQIEIGKEGGDVVPGLGNALAELELAAVGQTRPISFVPAEDRVKPQYRGQEVKLTVALREIRMKVVPSLDDDFARDTGEAETLAELEAKYRAEVSQEDADTAEREARQRLVEALLERNPFEPAPSLVTREAQAQVQMFKQQLSRQGMTLKQIGMTEARLSQSMRAQATFNVKAFLLLEAIREKESIDVSEEELAAEVAEMAEAQGQNPARLRATMEKNNQILVLRAQMREDRVLEHLMSKAELTEAPDPEPEAPATEAASEASATEASASGEST
ncbi:trigger factor [Nannocystaceae bacterium ST9]